ncbi:MAG TPA: dihydrofolate reductase family protein [Chitinophagaceae bacterium]|nr:dihydrofolate reductase family protein [Chitinophagaceae bacterium]
MRKLIYSINLTIDGCADHMKIGPPAADLFEHFIELTRSGDTLLYGRKLYEIMFPYWPDVLKNPEGEAKESIQFAEVFCAVENIVVVSKTLQGVEEKNARIIRSNFEAEVLALKAAPGKNILTGGVELCAQLTQLGLIDEYQFVIYPAIAGAGRRLWDSLGLPDNLPLQLVECKAFQSGFVLLRYVKS